MTKPPLNELGPAKPVTLEYNTNDPDSGAFAYFSEELMCYIDSIEYNYMSKRCRIVSGYFDETEKKFIYSGCADMRGAIKFATRMFPECTHILVDGHSPSALYFKKESGGWDCRTVDQKSPWPEFVYQ